MPVSLGQVIGAGGQAGLAGYSSSLASQRQYQQQQALIGIEQQKAALTQLQVEQARQQLAIQQGILSRYGLLPGGGSGTSVGALSGPTSQGAYPTQGAAADAGQLGAPTGGPAQSTPGGTNLSDMSTDQAIALQAVPALAGMGKSVLDLKKITALRPGAPGVNALGQVVVPPTPIMAPGMQFDMTTRSASPVPGYAQGAAGIAGAVAGGTAAGKAPYEFVPGGIPQQGGGSMPSTVSQFLSPAAQMPPSQAVSAPASPSPAPMVPMASRTPQSVPLGSLSPGDQPAAAAVQQATALGKPLTLAGQNQAADPWATMPKLQMPSGPGAQTTYSAELSKQLAESVATQGKELSAASNVAGRKMATNNQALDLLDKANTGALGPAITSMKNVISAIVPGIPPADFDPSASQALYKDLTNSALEKGKSLFGSRFTQSEVGIMLSQAAPSATMAKEAIRFLLNTDNAAQQYQIQQSNDFGRYVTQGGNPLQFGSWYSQAFPMTNAISKVQLGTPQAAPAFTPQQIIDEMRRRKLAQ
jgi:hypothetical protein